MARYIWITLSTCLFQEVDISINKTNCNSFIYLRLLRYSLNAHVWKSACQYVCDNISGPEAPAEAVRFVYQFQ